MRGPNKKKRDGHSVERHEPELDEQRRGSVISITSTSSGTSDLDTYRFPQVPPAVHASVAMSRPESRVSLPHINSSQPPSPQRQVSKPHNLSVDIPPSPLRYPSGDAIGPASPPAEPQIIMGPPFTRRARPRPPPLHLGDAAFFDASAFMQRSTFTPDIPMQHPAGIEDTASTYAARRQSLPSYLVPGFAPTPPVFAAECLSQLSDNSHSRSNSTSEAPMTPFTVPDGGFDFGGELEYPDDMGAGYAPGQTLENIEESKEPNLVAVTVMNASPLEAHMSGDLFTEMQG